MNDRGAMKQWIKAGRELRGCDPKRFEAMLEIAERITQIHANPMSVRVRVTKPTKPTRIRR